ncbi:MAG: hypothetical protein ABIH86_02340 [Planctomycetota bacterium]
MAYRFNWRGALLPFIVICIMVASINAHTEEDDEPQPSVPEIQMTVWTPIGTCGPIQRPPTWRKEYRSQYIEWLNHARPSRGIGGSVYVRRGMRVPFVLDINNNWGRGYTTAGQLSRDVSFRLELTLHDQQPTLGGGLKTPYYRTVYTRDISVPASSNRQFVFSVRMPRSTYPSGVLSLNVKQSGALSGSEFSFPYVTLDRGSDSISFQQSGADLVLFLTDAAFSPTDALVAELDAMRQSHATLAAKPKKNDDVLPARRVAALSLRGDEINALSSRWPDLETVDMIVILGTPDAFAKQHSQRLLETLDDWTRAGGRLVCFPGGDVSKFNGSGLTALFDVDAAALVDTSAMDAFSAPRFQRVNDILESFSPRAFLDIRPSVDAVSPLAHVAQLGKADRRFPLCIEQASGCGVKTLFSLSYESIALSAGASYDGSLRGKLSSRFVVSLLSAQLDSRHDARLFQPMRILSRDASALQWESDLSEYYAPWDDNGEIEDFGFQQIDFDSDGGVVRYDWSPVFEEAVIRERIENSLKGDSPVVIPDASRAAYFLLMYLLIAVPLNVTVFSLLRRREYAWASSVFIALAFTIAAYFVGLQGRASQRTINQIGFVEMRADGGPARATAFTSLYSPSEGTYTIWTDHVVAKSDEAVFCDRNGVSTTCQLVTRVTQKMTDQLSKQPQVEVDQSDIDDEQGAEQIGNVRVLDSSTRSFETQAMINAGQGIIGKGRTDASGGFVLDVENRTGRTLLYPTLIYNNPGTGAWHIESLSASIQGGWQTDQAIRKTIPPSPEGSLTGGRRAIAVLSGRALTESKDDEFPGKSSPDYYNTDLKAMAFNQPPRFEVTSDGMIVDWRQYEHPAEKRWRSLLDATRRVLRPDLDIDMSDPKAVKYYQRDLRRFEIMARQLFARAADRSENDAYFHRGVSRQGYFNEPVILCWSPTATLPLSVKENKLYNVVYHGLTLVVVRLVDESATSTPRPKFGIPAQRDDESDDED